MRVILTLIALGLSLVACIKKEPVNIKLDDSDFHKPI